MNHLPFVTALWTSPATTASPCCAELLADADARADEPLPMDLPDGLELMKHSPGPGWTTR